jgi:hypothetical protein
MSRIADASRKGAAAVEWLDRLQEATGWQGPRREHAWASVEAELGTELPGDWKELWARFGPGSFSYYVFALPDGEGAGSLLHWWRGLREQGERDPEWMTTYFDPYALYDPAERKGLIMWGRRPVLLARRRHGRPRHLARNRASAGGRALGAARRVRPRVRLPFDR